MINRRKKLTSIILITMIIIMLCFLGVNGNGQNTGNANIFNPGKVYNQEEENIGTDEPPPEEEQEEKQVTDLNVLLIDNINGSRINLQNCILRLVGEMQIAEDMYTYDNFFVDGNIYKITVLIELKEEEKSE